MGWRLLASLADGVIVSTPASAWQLGVVAPRVMTEVTDTAIVSPWIWLLHLAYFVVLEGLWGASLGKKLFGLRVTAENGAPASWLPVLRRTAVFFVPSVLFTLAVLINASLPALKAGSAGIADVLTADVSYTVLGSMASLPLLVVMFSTARRYNGWAGVHDLVSHTRVVSRAAVSVQRDRLSADGSQATAVTATAARAGRCGPFIVVSDAGSTHHGRLLVGFDPVLRRQVWIHEVAHDTPPTSAGRRDVSRVGRLHWLTGRRGKDDNWDAFEAPDGEPFLARRGTAAGWPTLKLWLLDLVNELTAGTRDGSIPPLGLDRLWLKGNGHLIVLDFPAPGLEPTTQSGEQAGLTPVGLLSAVATRALSPAQRSDGPTLVPLRARALINSWSGPEAPALEAAREALVRVAAVPDRDVRWRRAIPIAIGSVPTLLALVVPILALPALFQFMGRNTEMLRLLESLHQRNRPVGSRLADPVIRDAAERYLVGRYGALLADDRFWSSPPVRGLQDRRRTAADILARHPSVSADELARASALIAPELEGARRERAALGSARGVRNVGGPIILALTALTLLLGVVGSVISSIVVPGGVMTRLLGLAVVTRDRAEIRRGRSLVRALVAWLPALVWLAYLAKSPKIQGSGSRRRPRRCWASASRSSRWRSARHGRSRGRPVGCTTGLSGPGSCRGSPTPSPLGRVPWRPWRSRTERPAASQESSRDRERYVHGPIAGQPAPLVNVRNTAGRCGDALSQKFLYVMTACGMKRLPHRTKSGRNPRRTRS